MEFRALGRTGIQVSTLCLGTMTFGHEADEDASRAIVDRSLEAGGNFLDTADVYSVGSSEEFLGRALEEFADRDDVVIATKVHGPMRKGPNSAGLSRKAISTEVEHSLTRLGTVMGFR